MQIVRSETFFHAPTLCYDRIDQAMGLVGVLVKEGVYYHVRQAFVPIFAFVACIENADEIKQEIAENGSVCHEPIARAWFPDLEGKRYRSPNADGHRIEAIPSA